MTLISDIDHLQLAIPPGAEEVARTFYGGLLEMKEIEKPSTLKGRGGVWFSLGARQFHLGVQEDFRPATKVHPAFLVDNMGTLECRLREAGHPIVSDDLLPGYERFYSNDPFGNRLEFLRPM